MKTEKTLSVDARIFFAIANFRGINDVRYYLDGVYVEPCAEGGVVVVATNGYTLAAMRDPGGSVSAPLIVPVSLPLEKCFLKSKQKGGAVVTDNGLIQWWDDFRNTQFIQPRDAEIDGKFPKWRKVLPKVEERSELAAAWFNPDYLTPFAKAAAVLSGAGANDYMRLYGAGKDKSALVRISGRPDFVGVVMPARCGDVLEIPHWAVEPETESGTECRTARPEGTDAKETVTEEASAGKGLHETGGAGAAPVVGPTA